jgi:hypothetical protein
MDKKILLSGAAALIMGFGFATAPAQASAISLSTNGEASLSILMSDHCNVDDAVIGDTTIAANDAHGDTSADALACTADNEENPYWTTDSSFEWTASGTLANGLTVSADDGKKVSFGGAFGNLSFKAGGDSAVKAARVGGEADPDVVGNSLGAHPNGTSGTADGMVALYQAPSMGGMDLFVSYSPSSDDSDEDGSDFTDTIGFGAKFSLDQITIGAGFEAASNNDSASCDTPLGIDGADEGDDAAEGTLIAQADEMAGGTVCGDESVMGIGASMSVGDMTVNAGYSKLDSDGADITKLNLGLGMSVGDYSLTLDYIDATKDYVEAISDDQTIIAVGASTSLGDGVDLGLTFSNNQYSVAGADAHTNYRAEAKVTITY